MENIAQQLIDNIRTLFAKLIEEEEIRTNIRPIRTIYPQNHIYVSIAKELYNKALELEAINKKYSTDQLKDVMGDEVDMVGQYNYDYKKNTMIPKAVSLTKLQNLMHNATYHIQMYFFDVLGDIKID
ncbi:hypothetical protein SAMN02910409_0570 [Prevotellaceae bacterium HUN156]|nr:hypothetical protein SAMN02910409_0570 [Prevotellaceae bacterium HUN156]